MRPALFPETSAALICGVTLAAALLAAPAARAEEMREISASLTYRQRIALPDEAWVTLRLTDAGGAEVMTDRFPTAGRQVPIEVIFGAPAGELTLEAGIAGGARDPGWAADPVAIPAGTGALALGPIEMHPVPPTWVWTCGGEELRVQFSDEEARLETGGETIALRQTVTASGARYESPADPGTWIWNKGDDLTASLAGRELAECRLMTEDDDAGAEATPVFTARGNEPGWRIDMDGETVRLRTQDGTDETLPRPEAEEIPGGRRYPLGDGLSLSLADGLCHDTMTGMPHPAAATLTRGDEQMTGCAGDPMELLEGAEWQVDAIGGAGLVEGSKVTLAFEEGRVAGTAGCNRYFAAVTLGGEGLSFGPAGSTMMACPDPLMQQERKFLDALARVDGFDIDAAGTLVLTAGGESVIGARR